MHKNKGFTLLEMLIVLLVISSFSFYTLSNQITVSDRYEKYSIVSDIAKCQNDAIFNRLTEDYINSDVYSDYDIYFNGRGNSNMAQTINVKDKYELIISLGSGRVYEKEERVYPDWVFNIIIRSIYGNWYNTL